jgi:lipoprotein-anchoring transpeptidase ErfK/SrfK
LFRRAIVVAIALGLPACASHADNTPRQAAAASVAAQAKPIVETSPPDGADSVLPDTRVAVFIRNADLRSVAVRPVTGTTHIAVPGGMANGVWTSSSPLTLATTYQGIASFADAGGHPSSATWSFTTVKPTRLLTARIAPLDGDTVGVGQPIALYFNVAPSDHAAVVQALSVSTTPPVAGAWHWVNSKELHYRPQDYWPAHTTVNLGIHLNNVDVGKGVWGGMDRSLKFTIGDAHVSIANVLTHQMTVYNNGQVVKTIPISAGRQKYPTSNGVHVVLWKAQDVLMDSATVGIPRNSPDGYYEHVAWDVRISNSGEFVHAAPWSVASQGNTNVSHGCINISVPDATWFYVWSRRGDVVAVTGSPRQLEPGNGYTDWNVPWTVWSTPN